MFMPGRGIPKLNAIVEFLFDEEKSIDYLFNKGVLDAIGNCDTCGAGKIRIGKLARCRRKECRKSVSIFRETFFCWFTYTNM